MHKRNYSFTINIMTEIFDIRSCIKILVNNNYVLQLIKKSVKESVR